VCSPRGETHQVFMGKPDEAYTQRVAKLLAYLPILFRQREHVFSVNALRQRRPLSESSKQIIDRVLYREKILARGETQNRYKSEGVEYTLQEIGDARLLCKNLNGLAYTTALFASMYPDATFFGLVRNGLAVCEGAMRRGMSAADFGQHYAKVCGQIAADAARIPAFHLVRYEMLAEQTLATAAEVFKLAHLDPGRVEKYRLVVDADTRRTGGGAEQLKWYSPEEFEGTISAEFNNAQIERLPNQARTEFLRVAGYVMEQLGYLQ
jgi:hypothetical protein